MLCLSVGGRLIGWCGRLGVVRKVEYVVDEDEVMNLCDRLMNLNCSVWLSRVLVDSMDGRYCSQVVTSLIMSNFSLESH